VAVNQQGTLIKGLSRTKRKNGIGVFPGCRGSISLEFHPIRYELWSVCFQVLDLSFQGLDALGEFLHQMEGQGRVLGYPL
jgi:hypothetical protein